MNLADQIAMVDIVKKELDNAEKAIDELEIFEIIDDVWWKLLIMKNCDLVHIKTYLERLLFVV